MRRSRGIVVVLLCLSSLALARPPHPAPASSELRRPSSGGHELVSSSSREALLQRESAGPDTFDLYGGLRRVIRDPDGVPGSGDEYVEGKFEDPNGRRARGLSDSPNDWTGVDFTEVSILGRVSDFNAANLDDNGAGNLAYWFGVGADDPAAANWETAPGYGNNWRETLVFETPVSDPAVGQTIGLDFVFNIDTERGYDFVSVEFDSAGSWVSVFERDGTNRDVQTGVFEAPGLRFAEQPETRSIVFVGNDYGFDDHIRLRVQFRSDGAYSDEDGLFDSDGAAQIDDVVITTSEGVFEEDFEDGTLGIFTQGREPFAGDFSDVYEQFDDLDPCRENDSPVVGFIDYGQDVPNGPAPDGTTSTGGSTSFTWDYGIDGGYVVNYTDGISDGRVAVNNEVWSPAFDWDLPGGEDDDPAIVGAVFGFSVFRHNPLVNGIFYVWHVRSQVDGVWERWEDRRFVYFSVEPEWRRFEYDVTDLIAPGAERIQVALGVVDLSSVFGFVGQDATPGPIFDDVRFYKYRVAGPLLRTQERWLAQDAFPASGEIALSTPAERDLLDVRFDMADDVGTGSALVSGDSLVVDTVSPIADADVIDLRLVWLLRHNSTFELDLRQPPSGPFDENFESWADGGTDYWRGEVVADTVRTASGTVVDQRFFADLPDEDFLYPGDRLHFYWQATDSEGRVSTLPSDVSGFGQWDTYGQPLYGRDWEMRALPSVGPEFYFPVGSEARDLEFVGGPDLLVIDEGVGSSEVDGLLTTMRRLGYREGRDFDVYTVRDPEGQHSNGIGSFARPTPLGDRRGPGARPQQLTYYDAVLVLADDRRGPILSDGTSSGSGSKGNDFEVLAGFKDLAGTRIAFHFGGRLASGLDQGLTTPAGAYLANDMAVEYLGDDVTERLGDASTYRVEGVLVTDEFELDAECPDAGLFDQILPIGVAQTGWRFRYPNNAFPILEYSAGVIHSREEGGFGDLRVDVTFPFAFTRIDGLRSERLQFLNILFDLTSILPSPRIDAPGALRPASFAVFPNPFNPSTTVAFDLPRAGMDAQVAVYDVRGQRVRLLHDGVSESADLRLTWDGRDERGARVASGVYLVKAVTAGFRDTQKVALIK